MSPPDPERRPPGHSPPDEEAPYSRSTASDRVSIFDEERRKLKQRLEMQELIHDFSDQMRSQRDLSEIGYILTHAVSELTSFRNAFIAVLDEDGRTLRGVVISGHKRTVQIGERLAKTTIERVSLDFTTLPPYSRALTTGEIVYHRTKEDIVNTLAALTDLNPGILEIIRRTTRMNLALTVPLFIGDRETGIIPLGIMGISSTKTEVDPEDVRILRILTDQASLAIHNIGLFKKIQGQAKRAEQAQTRFRRIIDSAHDMIISYDAAGKVRFANNAIRESQVYSLEGELIDQDTLDRVHPDDQPRLVEAYLALHENAPIRGIEYRIRDRNDQWLVHNLNAAVVQGPQGSVQEIVAFIRDVTVERSREKQVVRRNRELEILNALIINLTSDIDFKEMVDRSLTIISEFTGADMAIFISMHEPTPGLLNVVGHLWVPDEFLSFMASDFPRKPENPLFSGIDVQVMSNLEDVTPEYRSHLDRLGLKTIVSIPVVNRGEPMGYVLGGVKGPLVLDDEDRAILRAVGDQLGIVFETARRKAEAQE
jgi:PAS domain S-box-containing protein